MGPVTAENVLVYYPNLIGYARIAFMLLSFYFATISWKLSTFSYLCAFIGDVVDGHVARRFNQSKSPHYPVFR